MNLINSSNCNQSNRESLLSESELRTQSFYDKWIGGKGFRSFIGRLVFNLSGVAYAGRFIKASNLDPQDRVLEVGSGLGQILATSHRRIKSKKTYIGIDISYQMIQRSKQFNGPLNQCNPLESIVASGLQIPFQKDCFDVVLLSHVLKYLTDSQVAQVLEEIKTVLLPKGRIVLWEFKPYPCATINHLIVRGSGSHRLRTHREVETLLKEGGFQNIQPFHIHTPWPPWRNLAYTAYVE